MFEVKVDESELRKIYLKKLDEHLEKMDNELLFWDTDDLMKQTRLSWNTIQKEFFYDPRFPKRKLGRKWLFPARKTKEFLLEWLDEQE
ncbi:hypothetical protein GCM10009865_14390 [Aeromicrobium ponti]|uniref:Group-specific protein n=1 Tax=Cytobacillus oceanisediminis TaxID=665099 RepID=A0A562K0H9_9BACI|nr:group-specific protein [Cytobacillus oceanisediminis]TWH88912.1 hypothetical protein IQ19_01332 [Cytobacillus oceanisediminis]